MHSRGQAGDHRREVSSLGNGSNCTRGWNPRRSGKETGWGEGSTQAHEEPGKRSVGKKAHPSPSLRKYNQSLAKAPPGITWLPLGQLAGAVCPQPLQGRSSGLQDGAQRGRSRGAAGTQRPRGAGAQGGAAPVASRPSRRAPTLSRRRTYPQGHGAEPPGRGCDAGPGDGPLRSLPRHKP